MPAITGIIADKWVNAEKLYGILHILGGIALFYIPQVDNPTYILLCYFCSNDLLYANNFIVKFNCI